MCEKKLGFQCAYNQLPIGVAKQARKELREALGVSTDFNLHCYVRGDREPKLSQAIAVEAVFQKYGIAVNWGCEEPVQEEV